MSSTTRYRPKDLDKSSGGSKFLGFLPVGLVSYEDRSSEYDWADVYLSVTLQSEGSQYPVEMKIVGSYDREPGGNIESCTLLKRVYWLFDAIGFQGGPNVQGEWVDEEGNPIDNIENHLNEKYLGNPLVPKMDYYAYVYKEPGKKDPSKAYTTVYPRLVSNTEKNRSELESYIAFLKGKNLIKEVTSTNTIATPNSSPQTSDSANVTATQF